MKFVISEITIGEYLTSKGCHKVIECLVPNYYYRLEIGDSSFVIDSNNDLTNFILKEATETNELIFASEDRLYIFSLKTGQIKLAIKTFDPIVECKLITGFILVFTEKMMFKILSTNTILHSVQTFSDIIEDIKIEGRNLIVNCFDGSIYKIVL